MGVNWLNVFFFNVVIASKNVQSFRVIVDTNVHLVLLFKWSLLCKDRKG